MAYGKGTTTNSAANSHKDKEYVFPKGPEDTVSALRWSPVSNHLAAASWDGKVYIYDATNTTSSDTIKGVAAIPVGSPVLDCDFNKDGTIAVGASADKKLHLMDLKSSQTMTLEGHTSPVRTVRFVDVPSANAPIIASGSWDRTVRYWDMRQPQPIGVLELPERVYAMDTGGSLLAISTAENQLHFVNLHDNPLKLWKSIVPPIPLQTTAVSVTADGTRWAIGTIAGRAAAQVVDEKDLSLENLSFKCHREAIPNKRNVTDVYTINDVAWWPGHKDVFATAGSDGTFSIWDVRNRNRLRSFPKVSNSVTAINFTRDGTGMAYAMGYDWTKGHQHSKAGAETKIVMLRFETPLKEREVVVVKKKTNYW
ncbi:WD40-repeat-containing domain protein [Chaetomium tenue]|uniref:WD40-repeat-containing domain protein n=1 Tax=Chaetomium tenue TaxID=1854479 RepID=A0ACB7PD18_9PEZI|nr:WD40-repeat-containing domain protein [Chaetomium globosum]